METPATVTTNLMTVTGKVNRAAPRKQIPVIGVTLSTKCLARKHQKSWQLDLNNHTNKRLKSWNCQRIHGVAPALILHSCFIWTKTYFDHLTILTNSSSPACNNSSIYCEKAGKTFTLSVKEGSNISTYVTIYGLGHSFLYT